MSKYYNAVKVKLVDENQIYWLNYVREIFSLEYELLKTNPSVKLNSFTEQELSHCFRGHFVKKLAELTNKNYGQWDLNNRFRYFKMFSMHLRQDFNSLNYKQSIVDILEKYNFDLKKSNKEIREELVKLNLYPTKQELMNIIRSKNNNNSLSLLQNYYQNGFSIPLDFTLGQDKQTILHPDEKQPVFHINLNGNWIWFDFRDNIKFQYIQDRINSDKFVRFCKPKFIFNNEDKTWYCILAIESASKKNTEKNSLVVGVDIGQVKPYSAVILNRDETNLKASLVSKELTASKETKLINSKLERVKEHLSSIYHKINVYENIIKNNINDKSEFTNHISKKLEERNREKRELRRKRKELQKRKSYLVARDLMRQLNFFNVKKINLERLNWVEHTGGSWDFSQQQDILEQKAIENGIEVIKVYAANTSKENPFIKKPAKQKNLLGKPDPKTRKVKFKRKKYQIDRDILGAINIALRDKNNKFRLKYNQKKLKKMIIWLDN